MTIPGHVEMNPTILLALQTDRNGEFYLCCLEAWDDQQLFDL